VTSVTDIPLSVPLLPVAVPLSVVLCEVAMSVKLGVSEPIITVEPSTAVVTVKALLADGLDPELLPVVPLVEVLPGKPVVGCVVG
jgi:hypothetical protein